MHRPRATIGKAFAAFVLAATLAACGELADLPTAPQDDPIDASATFTRVQNEIFTPTCASAGCHGSIAPQQGLVLTSDRSYEMIVGVPSAQMPALNRIQRRSPLESYLYRKVTGGAITGERMPVGGPYLSGAQISLLRNWIRRGAPND